MSDVKYHVPKCVQSKLAITQLSLVKRLFYLSERSPFLSFASLSPFMSHLLPCMYHLMSGSAFLQLPLCILLSSLCIYLLPPFLSFALCTFYQTSRSLKIIVNKMTLSFCQLSILCRVKIEFILSH